jgi:hypothetical protein
LPNTCGGRSQRATQADDFMMKLTNRALISAASLGLLLLTAQFAIAQTTVNETTTTTTSAGTISEFGPETIIIRSESSPEPVRYSYSKTTTYVDETGVPVSIETVKSGLPVTVYYMKVGDRMVASKVVVRKAVVVPAVPTIIEKKTTTTTTESNK